MNDFAYIQNRTLQLENDQLRDENYALRCKLDKTREQLLEAEKGLETLREARNYREQLKAWGVQK